MAANTAHPTLIQRFLFLAPRTSRPKTRGVHGLGEEATKKNWRGRVGRNNQAVGVSRAGERRKRGERVALKYMKLFSPFLPLRNISYISYISWTQNEFRLLVSTIIKLSGRKGGKKWLFLSVPIASRQIRQDRERSGKIGKDRPRSGRLGSDRPRAVLGGGEKARSRVKKLGRYRGVTNSKLQGQPGNAEDNMEKRSLKSNYRWRGRGG